LRFSRRRNRRCTRRGHRWRWSRDGGDGDGCCGGAGAGEEEEEEEEKEENVYWWGQLFSTPQNSIGGDEAILKDRGDVVLAGTRRVFAHVVRKELFYAFYIVGTFEGEEEKEQEESKERQEKEEKHHIDRQRGERRGSQWVREKDRG